MFGFVSAQGWEVAHYSFCDRAREICVLAYRQAAAGMAIAPPASDASFRIGF